MRRNGDRAGVQVTEIEWATGGPGKKPVSERAQARLLRETVARLVRERSALRLTGVMLFDWRDAPPYAGGHDLWGVPAGLHAQDGRPKPVVSALGRLLKQVLHR